MIAIIPARGGSKGLPRKNILEIGGIPLIAHTIKAAISSKYIERVIVTTDSVEIANIAVEYGAEVPELRPAHLAGDNSRAIDTYKYLLQYFKDKENIELKSMVVLQPTSPLRTNIHIDNAIDIFIKKDAYSVISVTEAEKPIEWAKEIKNGIIVPLNDVEINQNRQFYKSIYYPNGAIFIFSKNCIDKGEYYSSKTFAYIMDKKSSIDIDTIFDFKIAKTIIEGDF